jgi:Tfp pilus assembly protein PilO
VTARLQSLSTRGLLLVAGVVVLVYAAAVWFLFVTPKRSEASEAKADLAAAELRLAEAQAAARTPSPGASAAVADVFRLAKAMPSSAEQPGLVLELARLAKSSGVTLRSLSPKEPVAGVGGPSSIPVTVVVGGNYAQITKFLRRTRALVTVRDGEIHARGRLLAVQSVSLIESPTQRFPKLDATIEVDAYVYDGPIVPPDIPAPPTGEEEIPAPGSDALGGAS